MSASLQLTLGLDLRPQTTGAVQFALWLCKAAELQPAGHVEAIHVIDPAAMVELIRHADEPTILGAFKQRGKEVLDEVAHGAHFHAPDIFAGDAVELLEREARTREALALVIARRAASDKRLTLSRLGSVARRLLRRLAQPTIVAPPDLLASEVGDGPIVVAVDFEEGSARALAWATKLAALINRPVELVHFAAMPDQVAYVGLVQGDRWTQMEAELLERGRERMDAFVRAHASGPVETRVVSGPVLPSLADHAASRKACLVVTGSGHHGLLYRVVLPSVASETAAMATTAVAVIP